MTRFAGRGTVSVRGLRGLEQLITQRSLVQIQPPQPRKNKGFEGNLGALRSLASNGYLTAALRAPACPDEAQEEELRGRVPAVPRQNLIRLGQERRDPSIRPQAKTPSLVGGRATGIVRPSALHGHTGVAMEDGEQVGCAAELDLGRLFDGSGDSRCWTTPPGGGSGDAGHRLRESPRSCPPRGARRA